MSNPSSQSPTHGSALPQDPEEAVTELNPPVGEDYGPPEEVDPDREADVADQVEQAIEVPVEEDLDDDADEPH